MMVVPNGGGKMKKNSEKFMKNAPIPTKMRIKKNAFHNF
jgi:hypothetical protein